MATTAENLKSAFAGESQANRRYTAFARKADEEGFSQIAKLFRAAAESETVHALNHLSRQMSSLRSAKVSFLQGPIGCQVKNPLMTPRS